MHTEMRLFRCRLRNFCRSVRVIRVNTLPSYRYQFGVRCGWPLRLTVSTTAICDAARYALISCSFTANPPGQTSFALLPRHSLAPVAEDALWLYVLHALSYLRTIHDTQRKCGDEQYHHQQILHNVSPPVRSRSRTPHPKGPTSPALN